MRVANGTSDNRISSGAPPVVTIRDVNQKHDKAFTRGGDGRRRSRLASSAGNVGLLLSLIGLSSLALVGWTGSAVTEVGAYLAFASLPGLVVSVVGHVAEPTKTTRWGMASGLFGSLYLATMWFGLTRL